MLKPPRHKQRAPFYFNFSSFEIVAGLVFMATTLRLGGDRLDPLIESANNGHSHRWRVVKL